MTFIDATSHYRIVIYSKKNNNVTASNAGVVENDYVDWREWNEENILK